MGEVTARIRLRTARQKTRSFRVFPPKMKRTRVGTLTSCHCVELSPIYKLIDEGRIADSFTLIRRSLFSMKNIPKAVNKLRLRFSGCLFFGP